MTSAGLVRRTPPEPLGLPDRLRGLGRCLVMGVLNVTPDSFSDGGRYLDVDAATARGLQMHRDGAEIIDVGGESTRPGAHRVPVEEELRRVIPVIAALAAEGVAVSIDTMRATVAERALSAGAVLVNDVSGGLADQAMLPFMAAVPVPYVAMHWRAHSHRMQEMAKYDDVVADVCRELSDRLQGAKAAGLDERRVVLDPGLGFAKTADHNWALLHHLDALEALGRPLLVGASRKSFLGTLLADPSTGEPRPMGDRDAATDAVSALAAAAGAWCVRVHDVKGSLDAVRVAAAWVRGSSDADVEER
jgi:dihydropteroate synthase